MKIKQIIPVPKGKNYYAVYTDGNEASGYFAERVDFLALLKNEYGDLIVEGLSGNMEPAGDFTANYFGTYSEDALKCELPELWKEIEAGGIFQNERTSLEQFVAEQREALQIQSSEINLLKEKIAELEKNKTEPSHRKLTNAEKIYGVETTDFDNPVLPILNEENREIFNDNRTEKSENQTSTDTDARQIFLKDLRFCIGKKIDFLVIKSLEASGMKTLGDVADKTFDELLQLKYIGKPRMKNLLAVLHSRGLALKDEDSAYLNSVAKLKRKGKTLTEISEELNIPKNLTAKYLKFVCRDLRNSKGGSQREFGCKY